MFILYCFLAGLGFSIAATVPASQPAITPAPELPTAQHFKRFVTSCSLTEYSAFTLSGAAFPASSMCTCNGGIQAGASRSVGKDGTTTWECAAGTTPIVVSTEEPTPTPTWVVRVEIGVKKFMVGDFDQSGFQPLMQNVCGPIGCDTGDPQDFQFNWTESSGAPSVATGTVTMMGNIDNDASIEQSLMSAINAALLKSSKCSSVPTTFGTDPARKRDIESSPQPSSNHGAPRSQRRTIRPVRKRIIDPPPTFETIVIPQCHVVNFLEAVLYSGTDPLTAGTMATMTFDGASKNPESLLCSEILGGVNDALGLLSFPGYVAGGVTIAEAFCQSG